LERIGDTPIRGEVVVVVEGDVEGDAPDVRSLVAEVRRLVAEGLRTREAARAVAERHGASANELYRAAIDDR
jgi:16S rRNA (cytidine1402-2'-O)-methyltransferase